MIPTNTHPNRMIVSVLRLAVACAVGVWLVGCSSAVIRPHELATRLDLEAVEVPGAGFVHSSYYAGPLDAPQSAPLWVFIDGDGRPWINGGREPASDPTSGNPLALRLTAAASRPALYLGRPCYDQRSSDPACSVELWTDARYSERVVDSMVAALRTFQAQRGFKQLILVGYSGGGAVAALMAPRLSNVRALVTLAANLDVAAWSTYHGYLPLDASLNPADREDPRGTLEIHLFGARDVNVPRRLAQRYFERRPHAVIWEYERFDHVCCWAQEWPEISRRLEREME